MATVFIDDKYLQNIANILRDKLNSSDTISPNEMIQLVSQADIYTDQLKKLSEGAKFDLVIPEGVTTLAQYAIYSSNITSITFPSTITTIAASACRDNKSLTSISIISDNDITIGSSAFCNCTALQNIYIRTSGHLTLEAAFASYHTYPNITIIANSATIASNAFGGGDWSMRNINLSWASGAVSGAPWSAGSTAVITYNYKE